MLKFPDKVKDNHKLLLDIMELLQFGAYSNERLREVIALLKSPDKYRQ